MRLVSFAAAGLATGAGRALGALDGEQVLALGRAAVLLGRPEAEAARLATLETMLEAWYENLALARAVAAEAATPAGRTATAIARRPFDSLTILPPVARPSAFRDAYCFEEHVTNARARRGQQVPAEWYEMAIFYYSNPGAFVGHRSQVAKPRWTEALDYELELGWVIGTKARDVAAGSWKEVVAGFTILNDWSARDVQRREMAVGLGPAKGKDFATSLGPALVTLDEFDGAWDGDRLRLSMEATVNGRVLSRGNSGAMHYTVGDVIARASQDVYLFPGDVFGSGTVGTGCLLELGPEVHRYLQPGDEVTLTIERLGALTNSIV
ncbi:MAG TPA: fumarylacetoacetate hydrolase family protein [Candidatus Eisenbacteria bacterium]|nr:fumarylacetoacetate hydrolase family protein [Candidatus Eisenbacteria bacterium]